MMPRILFRGSQLMLVLVCALREWVNVLTDIGQFNKTQALAHKIMAFTTPENVSTIADRSVTSLWVPKMVSVSWIVMHLLVGGILLYGMVVLLKTISSPQGVYQEKKLYCCLGLALGIFFYIFLIGVMAMDYFLSWMQYIDYNADIAGYALPLFMTLLYLIVPDLTVREKSVSA